MIEFRNVYKSYSSEQYALQDVSFSCPSGSICFLTGHSGAGKSTLLKLIAGLTAPSRGEISVGPFDIHNLKPRQIPHLRQQMGIVFQDNQLLNDRCVFDNVALPLIITGYRKREIRARVETALERLGLTHKADDLPQTLSGGEQQRVGIARAVVNRPKLLIADEPTGNLDAEMGDEIIQLFRQFNRSGVTVLIATHDEHLLANHRFARLSLQHGRLHGDQSTMGNGTSGHPTQGNAPGPGPGRRQPAQQPQSAGATETA